MAPPPAFEDATYMLYVLGEPGPEVSTDEFNNWYDNEHAPQRATVPGILSARRYKLSNSDPPAPGWLAVYELTSPYVLKSKGYMELWKKQSQYERDLLNKCPNLNRREYKLYQRRSREDYPQRAKDPVEIKKKRVLQTIALEPGAHSDMTDDDFDAWYHDEHLDDMHRVPGWLRSTRWVLQDVKGPNMKEFSKSEMPPKFLAIHEYEDDSFRDTKEFKEANNTPARLSIVPKLGKNAERGYWKLWKEF
ncbi:hypothetical protein NA57DRAFT_79648 [Rhizodiscina lignyota]|uniref:Uncharacterized protein n=1 Tax=Rhizodiscina lignyota TaxID=1504668 RepID=A0A9P4I806_9PEZI|nr:hypothetical protein NA57DRAFT_79648 [Rhizodiscina lignyota]